MYQYQKEALTEASSPRHGNDTDIELPALREVDLEAKGTNIRNIRRLGGMALCLRAQAAVTVVPGWSSG